MAAHPVRSTNWKPKKFVSTERRGARSRDPETALGLQLAAVVDKLDVDVLVVADLDGAAVASAGEEDAAMALAEFAAAAAKERIAARTITTTRGFVHIDFVDARGRTFVLAAFARFGVPSPIGVARAVNGAARILKDGLALHTETALPLVARGWGDWSKLG
jgi:hypothetical protein